MIAKGKVASLKADPDVPEEEKQRMEKIANAAARAWEQEQKRNSPKHSESENSTFV